MAARVFLVLALLLAGCTTPAPADDVLPPPGWGLATSGYPDRPWFVAHDEGRGFLHVLEPKRPNSMASMHGGVAVADHDGDGDEDVYVALEGQNLLYENQGDGMFRESSLLRGVADEGVGRAPLWFDADNDGDPDLFVGNMDGDNAFYRNLGDGHYEKVPQAAGMRGNGTTQAAAAADVDLDGDLDVLVGNYGAWWGEGASYGPSGSSDHDLLYINDGTGVFHEAAQAWGLEGARWTLGASFGDADRDGDPDLMVANDFGGEDPYYENQGDRFERRDQQLGIDSRRDGMGVIWFDADNDGDLEAYISNIYEGAIADPMRQGNQLWARGGDGRYTDMAPFSGTQDALWSWGGTAFDADSDGDLDLYVPNGFEDAAPMQPHHMGQFPEDGARQPNRFFENRGGGRFVEAAEGWGLDLRVDGRGVAHFDADGDGDLDLVHAVNDGRVRLLENQAPQGAAIRLLLSGTDSNRDAVGTWVTVHAGGIDQSRYTTAGHGYISQDGRWVHVGLGLHGKGDVTVQWPSGLEQHFEDVAAGAYTLEEGGTPKPWT